MRICGVELTGKRANFAVLEGDDKDFRVISCDPRFVEFDDPASAEQVRSLGCLLQVFFRDGDVETVVIKSRAGRGQYAGGSTSFKLECLIQLCEEQVVELLSPQTIAATHRRRPVEIPESLRKYQHEAFLTAHAYLVRSCKDA